MDGRRPEAPADQGDLFETSAQDRPRAQTPLERAERGALSAPPRAPAYGAFDPRWIQRAGLALTRRAPRGPFGAALTAAAAPAALFGPKETPADTVIDVAGERLRFRLNPHADPEAQALFLAPQRVAGRELALFADHLSAGATVLDAGAGAGLYTLFAAKAGGASVRVLALEPGGEARARLRFNAEANRLANVEIDGLALADYEGEEDLRVIDQGAPRAGALAPTVEAVRVSTLKGFMDQRAVARLDVLRLNPPGPAAPILAAFFAKALPARWPKLLILTASAARLEAGPRAAVQIACAKGYRLILETAATLILQRGA